MTQVRQLNGKTYYYHSEYPQKLQAHNIRDKLRASGVLTRITYSKRGIWTIWSQ